METPPDVHSDILAAAESRFRRFGFGKTTVAEIAADCGMSAGNLYRYFDGKEDIGAACTRRCMAEGEARTAAAIDRPGLTPADRLEVLMFTMAAGIHEQSQGDDLVQELVNFVTARRHDLVETHLSAIHALLARILADGNARGDFDVDDVQATAWTLVSTMSMFIYPPLVVLHTVDELRNMARATTALLVRGLARCESAASPDDRRDP